MAWANAAGDEHRWPSGIGERKLAERSNELHARPFRQRVQSALEGRASHPRGNGEDALERCAHQGKGAAFLPILRRGIEQFEDHRLAGLESEARRLFEAKSDRPLRERLASCELELVARHGGLEAPDVGELAAELVTRAGLVVPVQLARCLALRELMRAV